jgi:hypothetical protein
MYVGVDNIIQVSGAEMGTDLKLLATSGKVVKGSGGFIVRYSAEATDTLRAYQSAKLLVSKVYEVRKQGTPQATIGSIRNANTTVAEVLYDPKIKVYIRNSFYNHGIKVIRFSIVLNNRRGVRIFHEEGISGNELNEQLQKEISKLKSADTIRLTDITATCPDCVLMRFDDIVLTIK